MCGSPLLFSHPYERLRCLRSSYTASTVGRTKLLIPSGLLYGVVQLTNLILADTDDGAGSTVLAYGVVVVCAFFQFGFTVTWGSIVWVVFVDMCSLLMHMITFVNRF